MSSTAASDDAVLTHSDRLEVLFEELAELAGQRNAIDGRIVQIAAQIDRDGLWGASGARSVAGLIGWKLGLSSTTAHTITTIADRLELCPYHHRLHHKGTITITGPAEDLVITDSNGRPLSNTSLARPPTTPHPTSHPGPGPSANAPTGGGTNPSNPRDTLTSGWSPHRESAADPALSPSLARGR